MLLLLLESRIIAPLVDTFPRPPETVTPVVAATEATLNTELELSTACFVERAVITLVSDTDNVELQKAAPST